MHRRRLADTGGRNREGLTFDEFLAAAAPAALIATEYYNPNTRRSTWTTDHTHDLLEEAWRRGDDPSEWREWATRHPSRHLIHPMSYPTQIAPDHMLNPDASVHRKTVLVLRDRYTDRLSYFGECSTYGAALAACSHRPTLDAYGPGTRYSYLTTPERLPILQAEMDAQRNRMDFRRTEAALVTYDSLEAESNRRWWRGGEADDPITYDVMRLRAVQQAFILDTMDRNAWDHVSLITLHFAREAVAKWVASGRPTGPCNPHTPTDYIPMMQREPRVGDQIEALRNYHDVVNHDAAPSWFRLGVVTKVGADWLVWIDHSDTPSFLWRFGDGEMNKAHRIMAP